MRIGSLFALCSLLLAAPALAQDTPGGSPSNPKTDTGMQPQSGSPGMDRGNQPGMTGMGMDKGMNLSRAEKDFVDKAAAGGMFEVQVAQLALQKSQSSTVKSFAQRMVDDHTKVNDQLKQIAQGN
jgi:putative membrane protein